MVILSDLWSCFSPRPSIELQLPSEKEPSKCVFCDPKSDRFDIIAEDDKHLVFKDRSPAALHHLLAIPRKHIPNIKSLHGVKGADLVRDLQIIGKEALKRCMSKDEGANEIRFGFHIPPFRSVEHLHLHCLVLPFKSRLLGFKYRVVAGDPNASPPTSKGWDWFVSANQAIDILRGGGRVKVGPC